ncbi:MAG TPA: helix-turn-helix domain-containing protein [Rhizomicrobium sp.]|nr:helix-turn-helix domain-containing protein [Rhizomicrobium sp.]
MLAPPDSFEVKAFSDAMVPSKDGFRIWNVLLNKWLLGAEGRALADGPFAISARLRVLPEMRFGWGTLGPSHYSRTPDVVAADNDDLFLIMNLAGPFTTMHYGREMELVPGDAYVIPCSERGSHVRPRGGKQLCLRVRRDAIQPLVRGLDDRLCARIPRDTEALRMLSTYLRVAMAEPLADEGLRRIAVRHVHDLLALALGAARDHQHVLENRGLNAARLRAAKVLVRRHLADGNLSPEFVAGRLGMSVRTLQRLFEQTGTTFSAFVIRERLETAYEALKLGPGRRSITDIALESGFGDVSHFNRKFRALYHASPSEIRRSAFALSDVSAAEEN